MKLSSLQKGLVAHYPLDKGSLQSAPVFVDKTPYENVGTKIGSVLKFDGSNDYVDCGNDASLNITSPYLTYSIWIKWTDMSRWTGVFGNSQPNKGVSLNVNGDGDICWTVYADAPKTCTSALIANKWTHVVGVVDNTQSKLYINGIEKNSIGLTGNIIPITSIWIARNWNYFFKGSIADTKIYNRALSPSEITTLYQGGAVSDTGLVAHYKFKDKSGVTLTDETGINNGTLAGFVDTTAGAGDGASLSGWNTDDTPIVFTPDRMGQNDRAMTFNGTSDYVDCGNDPSLNFGINDFTFESWIKIPISGTSNETRLADKRGVSGGLGWVLYFSSNQIILGLNDVGGWQSFYFAGTVLNDNIWHHVAVTFDRNGNAVCYLDGIVDGIPKDISGKNGSLSTGVNLCIGNINTGFNPFKGSINETRIYNRALSPDEVTLLYEQYRPKLSAGSLQKGLVLDMPLQDPYTKGGAVGSEILTDRTPYSNDGTNHGATISSDPAVFNGTSDYVDCGNDPSLNVPIMAVSAWIKLNSLSTDTNIGQMVANSYNSGTNAGFMFCLIGAVGGGAKPSLRLHGGSGGRAVSPEDLNIDEWYHIAGTYDGTNSIIYVNGIEKDTELYSNYVGYSEIFIGKKTWTNSGFFDGSIGETRLYNRTLSPDEVTMLYEQYRPKLLLPIAVALTYTGDSFAPIFSVSAGKTVTLSWGDGTSTVINGEVSSVEYTHNYATSDTYHFRITGDLDGITKFQYTTAALSGDIGTLRFLTSLTFLNLYNTSVSGDIANLSGLTSLTNMYLYNTSVSGDIANLSELTSLIYLYLDNTSISGDIANLSGMTSLTRLYLNSTSVSGDIANLSGMPSLTHLYLCSSSINTYTQGVLPNWDSCAIYIHYLGLSQQEVDDFLCDLDTSSVASIKTLNIGGTNAAPSATGLTCKNSLESKGWTVTVTI